MNHNPPAAGPIGSLSEMELVIAEFWREALQTDRLPTMADDFFTLGGDSLAMIMVEICVQQEFSIEFPPGALLHAPTLQEFSAFVDAKLKSSGCAGNDLA